MDTSARLDRLADLIASAPMNLVARGDRDTVRAVHVAESVAVGARMGVMAGMRVLDLGTGGGLPGLALAVCHPEVEWVLLDSVRKKVEAVAGFARALALDNVAVVWGRAEEVARDPSYRETFDGVTARAVAPLVVLLELARAFVRPDGWLWAIKGPRWEAEVGEAAWARRQLGWAFIHSERVASTVRPTWLVTMQALGPVSDAWPRAVGTPQRHPLVAREHG